MLVIAFMVTNTLFSLGKEMRKLKMFSIHVLKPLKDSFKIGAADLEVPALYKTNVISIKYLSILEYGDYFEHGLQ